MSARSHGLRIMAVVASAAVACRAPSDGADVDAGPAGDARAIDAGIDAGPTSHVLSVEPPDGATDVEVDGTIVVTLRADDSLVAHLTTLTVLHDGQPVPGTLEIDGDRSGARFRPSQPMARGASFTATVRTAAVLDPSHGLSQWEDPVTWSFTTTTRGWERPEELELSIGGLATAIDPAGVIHVLWYRTGPVPGLYARRHVPGAGWEPAVFVDPAANLDDELTLHVGRGGHAVAILEREYSDESARMTRYAPGVGWSAPARVDPDVGLHATYASAVVADDGTAIVMYRHFDVLARRFVVWSRRQHVDGTWEDPVALRDVTNTTSMLELQPHQSELVVDRAGNVMAIWSEWHSAMGTGNNLRARRFTPDAGWSESFSVDGGVGGQSPEAVVDESGTVTIVWSGNQVVFGTDTVWAARYENGALGFPRAIAQGWRRTGGLVVDPSGAVTASWQDDDVGSAIRAARFEPGQGWQSPVRLDDHGYMGWPQPAIASSPNATSFVIWTEDRNHRRTVLARRFTPAVGWGLAMPVERIDADASHATIIATDGGEAVAFWIMNGALWMNRYRQ